MKVIYDGISYNGYSSYIAVDEPTECPMCKHSLKPTKLHSQIIKDDNSVPFLYVTYLCTHCRNSFICKFSDIQKENGNYHYSFNILDLIAPSQFEKRIFDNHINNVSPMFVKIYNQALEAEHYNLDEIAGIGYRKSVEFLIKDYCSYKNPNDIMQIQKIPLAQCISDYIDDNKIKKSAKVSTWLGNDETHYIKKFENKDITDLKRFIDTSVYFILYNLTVDEADEIINSQKKSS